MKQVLIGLGLAAAVGAGLLAFVILPSDDEPAKRSLVPVKLPEGVVAPPTVVKGVPGAVKVVTDAVIGGGEIASVPDCAGANDALVTGSFLLSYPPKGGFESPARAIAALGPEYRLDIPKFTEANATGEAVEFVQESAGKTAASILVVKYGDNWIVQEIQACNSLLEQMPLVTEKEIQDKLKAAGIEVPELVNP